MTDETKHTIWWCERCHASGEFPEPLSVYDAIDLLRAGHDAHALAWRASCTFDPGHVRVQLAPEPDSRSTDD